ncbi:MAG: hypothetical protein AAFO28_02285 [Pseudomonadota bacterium]
MNAPNPPSVSDLSAELAAALDWWRGAGVDSDFTDDATAWLQSDMPTRTDGVQEANEPAGPKSDAGSRSSAQIDTPPAKARIDFFADGLPANLVEFHEFWMSAPGLDAIGPRGRIAPRGVEGADLMVLVLEPEAGDRDRLLAGPQGNLLDAFLKAAGTDPANVYLASALPRHTPMADTQALAHEGLDAVHSRHIELARPKRLIGFGTGLVPLLGLDAPNTDKPLRNINHIPAIDNALVSEGLDTLLDMPRLKARFWRRWIEWSALH